MRVLDIFHCPHTADECCTCRKPKTGMIQKALDKYPQTDLNSSLLIGDSAADEGLASNMGLRFYLVNSNRSIKDVALSVG